MKSIIVTLTVAVSTMMTHCFGTVSPKQQDLMKNELGAIRQTMQLRYAPTQWKYDLLGWSL